MWQRRRLLGALGAGAAMPALAQFRVEISGVGATQIPIAVARFRDEAAGGQPIAAIVRANLERSGLFRGVDAPGVLDETSRPVMAEWRGRAVDALVLGSVTRLADGRFDVRYKLWDVVKGEDLGGQSQAVVAGDLRLAAHRISDAVYRQLTGEPGVFATRIAYVTKGNGRFTLNVADADGEAAQTALASPEPIISPAWSPDGKQLAYVSFETQKAVVWVQEVASGRRRVLANFRGSNSAPAWSPDGSQLALTLSRDGGSQLYLQPVAGGEPRRLATGGSAGAIDTEPAFTADGRTLYFVSDRGGGPQIYRMPVAGGSVERVTFDGSYNISPAVSPDGRSLAYIARNGNAFKLMLMDLASRRVQALTDTSDDESPSFAPNSRLVIYATRAGGRDVLMTTTLDGRIKTRLLSSGLDVREPVWGPYGR
ncbi:Tol-Pal system beta propeller repeat protein TolB [Calidifontimicrobium sp. SYSU G02091]|uniref:Tol-Pal system beta propeller repeat protein TolB n=1 Tax=Calidifontimicrobium sp. SYSU G02091 TaxID=2926421 RepID=UPI001F534DD7|nr:Tol-Pal system beta propeller repeat protein TolB [Calidifontimicrobium sp. SYSU G02091]MCI1191874.1 Tol-Pal system beta propeller repeat protein TolB [Calidifontimicrobium sp. SYSU G02091]